MPNAGTHMIAGGLTGAVAAASLQTEPEPDLAEIIAGAFAGGVAGRIPDILEPAMHPNHRAFFHSVGVLALVSYGTYRAWNWEPANDVERVARWLAVVGGVAYMSHLVLDASTPKRLPLV